METMGRQHSLCVLFIIVTLSGAAVAQELTVTNAFPNLTFTRPVFLTHSGDHTNRIFVVRQDGIINVFPNDSSVATPVEFLDLSPRLSSNSGEEGLLGLAFPPDFQTSRAFYVNYTAPSTNSMSGIKTVIARYAVSPSDSNRADLTSERILMEIEQPYHNHNGGMVAFGPDSTLYIGVGDGGDANDPLNSGQTLGTMLGKILRIDVRGDTGYTIPPDNPFARDSTGKKKEIWAYGLRNPWRFSFDDATGQLWVGDVGQGAREEIDIVSRGGNYGWNIMEGTICRPGGGGNCDTTGLIMPVVDYTRALGYSVTGGYVYRGVRLPQLRGAYIFGDYGSGNIFLLRSEGGLVTADSVLLHTSLNISSFGVDDQNELYVLAYGNNGRIMKLTGKPGPTSVKPGDIPMRYALEQNYPNPFNPLTIIKYTIGGNRGWGLGVSDVSLVVYDVLGRQVAVLVNESKSPGSYEVQFDGSGLASGVYIYRLMARQTDGGQARQTDGGQVRSSGSGPPDRDSRVASGDTEPRLSAQRAGAGSFVQSRTMILLR
jgi:glucose/arabinose dehydrogenase